MGWGKKCPILPGGSQSQPLVLTNEKKHFFLLRLKIRLISAKKNANLRFKIAIFYDKNLFLLFFEDLG